MLQKNANTQARAKARVDDQYSKNPKSPILLKLEKHTKRYVKNTQTPQFEI